jgi:hypothetical protein
LVGAGVGVGFQSLPQAGRQDGLVELDLPRRERLLVRAQLEQVEPGLVEQPLESLPGEEAQVGRVEQSPGAVLEGAGKEREPHAAVRHVGDRDDEAPTLLEKWA